MNEVRRENRDGKEKKEKQKGRAGAASLSRKICENVNITFHFARGTKKRQ